MRVLTITEVSELWGKNPVTVRRAIDSPCKPLKARRSGRVLLISYSSCVARWGNPKQPISAYSLI